MSPAHTLDTCRVSSLILGSGIGTGHGIWTYLLVGVRQDDNPDYSKLYSDHFFQLWPIEPLFVFLEC